MAFGTETVLLMKQTSASHIHIPASKLALCSCTMKTVAIGQVVVQELHSPPKLPKYRLALQSYHFTMNNKSNLGNEQQICSRRVSLDMSHGVRTPPMNAHSNRSSSYGPPASINGFNNGFVNDVDGPILPIPPVSCIPPRSGMASRPNAMHVQSFSRRQSAPGFYCREDTLASAVRRQHMNGVSMMHSNPHHISRRGSNVPAMGRTFNSGALNSPGTSPMMGQRVYGGAHPNSFERALPPHPPIPIDPFDTIHSSRHVGLSAAELDATVDEVIASASGEADGSRPYSNKVLSAESDCIDKKKKQQSRAQTVVSFPVKLYEILMDPKYSEYVTWLPHGRAWRILKQKFFEKEVIPKHFRSARYASFMRQVRTVYPIDSPMVFVFTTILTTSLCPAILTGKRLGLQEDHRRTRSQCLLPREFSSRTS